MNTKYSKTITKSITKSTLFINQIFTFMRKLSLVLVAMMAVSTAFAQISTGEINSSVIPRTGNRPQEGDFGMYIGASVTQTGGEKAVIVDECIWKRPDADAPIKDKRTITISAPIPGLYILDFDIEMEMLIDVTIQKTNHSLFSARIAAEASRPSISGMRTSIRIAA